MSRSAVIIVAAFVAALASPAFADSHEAHIAPIKKILPEIMEAIVDEGLVAALRGSNERRKGMTQAQIDQLEAKWQKEIDESSHPLVDSVVENSLAERMRKVVGDSGLVITEIGVIDAQGLSIAQSSANSDIWQGEEVKFTKTYNVGPEAIFIDEVEFDNSTQSMQSQANFTVKDPATGKAIGAVTVGVNVDAL